MIASLVAWVFASYAGVGILVGVAFVSFGLARVDRAALHAPWLFRLVILSGVAALWPWVLVRWVQRGLP